MHSYIEHYSSLNYLLQKRRQLDTGLQELRTPASHAGITIQDGLLHG